MACMPSRSVTSWMYSLGISAPFLLGQPLAGAERRGTGPGRLAGDGGDDLGVMHADDAADSGDDRNGGLTAAAHHADVGRIEVGAHVDDRHNVGPGRRRREVDHLFGTMSRELP